MAAEVERLRAQTVVVGSGPGGATVARELTRRGREVLILEEGAYHKPVGSWRTMLKMLDHMGNFASVEGTQMVRLLTVGGSTVSFCGVAFPPPAWLKERHGIDLAPYVDEVSRGAGPRAFAGPAGGEPAPSASWRPPARRASTGTPSRTSSMPAECDLSCPKCMIGCAKGAKWTARDYVEDALAGGARLKTQAHVEEVLSDGGQGHRRSRHWHSPARSWSRPREWCVAGGGLGTPMLLQASGHRGTPGGTASSSTRSASPRASRRARDRLTTSP